MGDLFVYVSPAYINYAYLPKDGSPVFDIFPYQSCEASLLREYVDHIITKVLKVKKSVTKIHYASFLSTTLGLEEEHNIDISDILITPEYFPLIINFASLYAGSSYNTFFDLTADISNLNILSNLSIYKSFDLSLSADSAIIFQALSSMFRPTVFSHTKIVVSGDLFSPFTNISRPDLYYYLLSFISTPGVYSLEIDSHYGFLFDAMGDKFGVAIPSTPDVIRLGTLINVPASSEVLLKSELEGTNQLFTFTKEAFQLVPYGREDVCKALVKSSRLPSSEHSCRGGLLGIMIDARDKTSTNFGSDDIQREKAQFIQLLNEVLAKL